MKKTLVITGAILFYASIWISAWCFHNLHADYQVASVITGLSGGAFALIVILGGLAPLISKYK